MSVSLPLSLMVSAGNGECAPDLEFYRQLFDNLYDGVYYVDAAQRVRFWNRGAERITGYAAHEVVGQYRDQSLLDHVSPSGYPLSEVDGLTRPATVTGEPTSERVYLRHKDGRRIAVDMHAMPVRGEAGTILGVIEVFRDASSIIALETALAKLRDLAMKDPLTGLANRRHVTELLTLQIELYQRAGISFSVLIADIDHFKRINDTWGHLTGDRVLMRFATTLQSQCRTGDLVGRIGGEEFLVMLPEADLDTAGIVAERLRAAIALQASPPDMPSGLVTVSIGVAEVSARDNCESLLTRADDALYRAKARGRNRVEFQPSLPSDKPLPSADRFLVCLSATPPG